MINLKKVLTQIVLVLTTTVYCIAQDFGNGFEVQYSSSNFGDVHMIDAMNIIISGSGANIQKSYDGGESWFVRTSGITHAPPAQDFHRMHFVNDTLGFAISNTAKIAKTINGGETWTYTTSFFASPSDIYFHDESIGFMTSDNGNIRKSSNGGVSWLPVLSNGGSIYAITGTSTTQWICGQNGNLRKSTNLGGSWQVVNIGTTSNFRDVKFHNDSIGWLVGDAGTIYKTIDAGNNWNQLNQSTAANFKSLKSVNKDTLFATAANDSVYRSFDGGLSWQATMVTSGQLVYGVDIDESTMRVVAVGAYGLLAISTDFGATYSVWNDLGSYFMYSSSFTDAQTGWMAGSGKISHTINGGKNWNIQLTGNWSLKGIHAITSQKAWAVGTNGIGYKTVDGGANWNAMNTGVTETISSVFFISNTKGWFCTDGGKIYSTANGGTSWSQQYNALNSFFHSVFFIDENTGWVGGNGSQMMMKTTNGGATWNLSHTGISNGSGMHSVYFVDANNGYAGGHTGTSSNTIYKTTDGGLNWSGVVNPVTTHCKSIKFHDVNNGYAACEEGFLVKTTDAGLTWNAVNTGYTRDLNTISIHNMDTLWLGTSYGNILGYNNCSYPTLNSISQISPSCQDSSVTLITDNIPGGSYQWLGPNGYMSTSNPALIGAMQPANQGVYYVSASKNGCSGKSIKDTVEIISPPDEVNIFNSDSIVGCLEDTTLLICGTAIDADYQWYYNGNPVGTNSQTFEATQAGNYTVQTSNSCAITNSPDTIHLSLVGLPTITLDSLTNVCANLSPFNLNIASISGGNYSGNGITSGMFDPLIAGPGDHIVSYYYQDAISGCDTTLFSLITVLSLPSSPVILGNDSLHVCSGDSVELSTFSQADMQYQWYYNSNPMSEMDSSIYIYNTGNYEVEVYNTCDTLMSNSVFLQIDNSPNVSLDSFGIVCIYDTEFPLTEGSPAGGVYSGTGVNNGTFNPAIAGFGTHFISYSYTDPVTGCDSIVSREIYVDECLGLNEFSTEEMRLFPNPSNDIITINHANTLGSFTIYTLAGKKLLEGNLKSQSQQVNISTLSSGSYIVEIRSGQKIYLERLIKK